MFAIGVVLSGCHAESSRAPDDLPEKGAITLPSLGDFEWQSRPLIAFFGDSNDPRIVDLRRRVDAKRALFNDRDMILVEVAGDVVTIESDRSRDSASALRERHSVGAGDFALILVGKDGGEKARSTDPAVLEEWFGFIDTMPMRRREMRRDDSK